MGGTRIMVLKLGEIIKTALFIIAGIVLIILLINFILPKDKKSEEPQLKFNPGTYTSTVELKNGTADISVTVSDDQILEITLLNMTSEQTDYYPLIQPTMDILAEKIVSTQSLEVTIPSESYVTGQVLLSAIDNALEQAIME